LTCGGRVTTQLRFLEGAAAAVYVGGRCMGKSSSCGARAWAGRKCCLSRSWLHGDLAVLAGTAAYPVVVAGAICYLFLEPTCAGGYVWRFIKRRVAWVVSQRVAWMSGICVGTHPRDPVDQHTTTSRPITACEACMSIHQTHTSRQHVVKSC